AVKAAPPSAPPARVAAHEHEATTAAGASRAAASPNSDTAPSPWSTAPRQAPPRHEPDSPEASGSDSSGGITGFFSSLFGGGQSTSQPSEARPASTGTLSPSATQPPRGPAVSSFEPQRYRSSEPLASRAAP